MRDEKPILPVSNFQNGVHGLHDVVLSMPAVVGKNGISTRCRPRCPTTNWRACTESASTLREVIDGVGFGVDGAQSRHFVRSSQKATALAAATFEGVHVVVHGDLHRVVAVRDRRGREAVAFGA